MAIATPRYQDALKALRTQTALAVVRLWTGLDGHHDSDIPPFLRRVLPIIAGSQNRAAALTNAYLGSKLGTGPVALDVARVLATARPGVDLAEVYTRPFVTVRTALSKGVAYSDAVASGMARLASTAETDVVLATRATATAVLRSDPRVVGYRRVPDAGACDLCLKASRQRYRTGDLMPIHNRCGCTVEPILAGRDPGPGPAPAADATDAVVHEHGELGPVLARAGDRFTEV